jgi:sRNA-binding regulator protein Hfq
MSPGLSEERGGTSVQERPATQGGTGRHDDDRNHGRHHDRRQGSDHGHRADRGQHERGAGPRRKSTPPARTHAEEFYYLKQMTAQTPMVVVLEDGEEIRGWIEWYDQDVLKVHRHEEPNLLIYKRHIRYLFKDPELAGPAS